MEQGKFIKLLEHPILTLGMYYFAVSCGDIVFDEKITIVSKDSMYKELSFRIFIPVYKG